MVFPINFCNRVSLHLFQPDFGHFYHVCPALLMQEIALPGKAVGHSAKSVAQNRKRVGQSFTAQDSEFLIFDRVKGV